MNIQMYRDGLFNRNTWADQNQSNLDKL